MNTPMIRYIIGRVLALEGLFMLLPCAVAVIYSESTGWYFAAVSAGAVVLGFLLSAKKPGNNEIYIREGCVATALSWIVLSLVGCLPFYLSGEIPVFVDAVFETVSGFTTTGASILSYVEDLSYCMIFWRSFTHWLGGMGVLVFLLAVLQLPGGYHMNLMKAESPGPVVGKLRPKVRQTAQILYLIYLGMTVAEVVLLLIGNMPLFDALTISFGTAGTGGFGIKNDSMMSNTPYQQWVVAIFMMLFGVNFNFYYLMLFRRWKEAFRIEEVRNYLLVILVSIAIIMLNLGWGAMGFLDTLRHVTFQVSSIITTTGYSTIDFDAWPEASHTVLLVIMYIGACAGSTGGGIKVSRLTLAAKQIFREIRSYVTPRRVESIEMDGHPVDPAVLHSVNIFFVAYVLIATVSIFLLSLEDYDPGTNFSAVAATLNNIGPGLSKVGPTGNFGFFRPLSKVVLIFDMLAGRLELYPILLLFYPGCWRDLFRGSRPKWKRALIHNPHITKTASH